MATARWNGQVLAESNDTKLVEGNHYFPPESLRQELFAESSHTSYCPWKGTAGYFDLIVNGETNKDAAWVYREPKPDAASIKDHVAFWRGVEVSED